MEKLQKEAFQVIDFFIVLLLLAIIAFGAWPALREQMNAMRSHKTECTTLAPARGDPNMMAVVPCQ